MRVVKRSEGESVASVSLHGCVLGGGVLRLVDQRLGGFRDVAVLVAGRSGGGDLSLNEEKE